MNTNSVASLACVAQTRARSVERSRALWMFRLVKKRARGDSRASRDVFYRRRDATRENRGRAVPMDGSIPILSVLHEFARRAIVRENNLLELPVGGGARHLLPVHVKAVIL